MADLTRYRKNRTLKLTTVGRKTGKRRSVTIWFVVADSRRVHVQHARGDEANWYRNLVKNPDVEIDFGDGPMQARATPITERDEIRGVLTGIRRKYPFAWVFQLLGLTRNAVAAVIEVNVDS